MTDVNTNYTNVENVYKDLKLFSNNFTFRHRIGLAYKNYPFQSIVIPRTWNRIIKYNTIKTLFKEMNLIYFNTDLLELEKYNQLKKIKTLFDLLQSYPREKSIFLYQLNIMTFHITSFLKETHLYIDLKEMLQIFNYKLKIHPKNQYVYIHSFKNCTIDLINNAIIGKSVYEITLNHKIYNKYIIINTIRNIIIHNPGELL